MERFVAGHQLGKALAEALGIYPSDQGWSRIVIVADVNEAARVYVAGYIGSQSLPAIVEAVKDISVNDAGTLVIEPNESPIVVQG